ncbi:MAG TPA: PAS domain S-box protein [Candidatus Dormibacteraeota bacterium]|nr:PAS domain S-box protein [Candidatus Dormibacteraeota bacterium]
MQPGGPTPPALAPKLAVRLSRPVVDPLFNQKRTRAQGPPPLFGGRSRMLVLINAVAVLAIAGGVAFGIAASGPPAAVLEQEAAIIAVGLVYAAASAWIRSTPWGSALLVRLLLVFINVALVVAALGLAGPWLQGELPPLAVAAFAALLLYWDSGYGAGRIGYVLLITAAGLGLLWVDAIATLMVPVTSVLVWSLVLLGLVLFAYVTRHVVDRNLVTQAGRQGSLLDAVSELGEGLVITEDGRFVTGNEAYVKLTGYSTEELAAMPSLIDLAPADQRAGLTDQLAKRMAGAGDVPVHYESALVTKDGRRIQVETSIRPLVAEGPHRLLAVVRDVTDRHRSEEAERESETRFRTLFEQSQAGMAFADLNGRLTSTNEAFRMLVGYSEQELRGVSVLELTHPEDLKTSEEALRRVLAGESPGYRIDKRYIRKDGQSVWVDIAARLVRDADGKAIYLQTVAVDIRDRMRAEVLQSARFAVTQALVTSPGWDKAAPHVLEGLCRALDWELGEYWEVDAGREAMHFATSWKRPGRDTSAYEATASQFTFRRGEGLAGRVWEDSKPVSLTDLAKDPSPRSAAAVAVGLHGLVGFPVRSGRRVVGMISLATWAPRELDEGLLGVMNDIGTQIGEFVERKRAEVALQESEKRMRSVLDNVSDGLVTLDPAGAIDAINPAVSRLFGYDEKELVGQKVDVLIATTHRGSFMNYVERRLAQDLPASGALETMGKRKNASLFPLEFLVNSMQVGARHLFIATVRDISERKAHTDALEYQALHDGLTGLPNRTLFGDRLRQALLGARRNQTMFGVLLLDLDRFKDINDALGHDRGDALLQEVASRLKGVLRATDTIARLGGDEFAVVSTDAKHPDNVVAAARKILASLEGTFTIGDHTVETGASIGIAMYPIHGDDPGTLLRRADVAMYVAKRSGGGFAVYSPEHEGQTLRQSGLAGDLRRSMTQGELVLHYQPIVLLPAHTPDALEALVRWNHPREGLLPPDRFIALAEETNVIRPLTSWVLDTALAQLSRWVASGQDVSVAVNVSPRCLDDHSIVEDVTRALATSNVEARRLTLEVSEGAAMSAPAAKALERLAELGVRLSLDDFGTGYSSLIYLKRLPVHEIKVDRSFVKTLPGDPDATAIVRAAVGLGHSLGLRVIAEGVEDRDAEAMLIEAGVDAAQGFFICRPAPEAEVTALLESGRELSSAPAEAGPPALPPEREGSREG